MKMIIKLNVPFTARGGSCFPGETIGVSRKVGKRLVRKGDAVEIKRRVKEVPRMEKPLLNPRLLRGDAKKDWLCGEIRKHGVAPEGDTIVALVKQLRAL